MITPTQVLYFLAEGKLWMIDLKVKKGVDDPFVDPENAYVGKQTEVIAESSSVCQSFDYDAVTNSIITFLDLNTCCVLPELRDCIQAFRGSL